MHQQAAFDKPWNCTLKKAHQLPSATPNQSYFA